MSLPADVLSDVEKAKLKEAFDEVDADGDGKISHGDLKTVFVKMGYTPDDSEIQEVIDAADEDGTGSINFDPEFCNAIVILAIKVRIAMLLARLFQAMDTDGSGYITKENLRQLTVEGECSDQVSDADLEEAIASADQTGDGQVSFQEFVHAFVHSED